MVDGLIKKVEGGYQVDGLDLLGAKCGCGGLTELGGCEMRDCCFTYSTVKYKDNTVAFFAKVTTPRTKDNYEWGYRVKKGPVEVDVLVYDTRTPRDFTFGGAYPPPASAWQELGWRVMNQFERPLRGPGPAWRRSPKPACGRKGDWDHPRGPALLERQSKKPQALLTFSKIDLKS